MVFLTKRAFVGENEKRKLRACYVQSVVIQNGIRIADHIEEKPSEA